MQLYVLSLSFLYFTQYIYTNLPRYFLPRTSQTFLFFIHYFHPHTHSYILINPKPCLVSTTLLFRSSYKVKTPLAMAKVGKLTKLKSAIKKWPSFAKNHHHSSSSAAVSDELSEDSNLHVVYVGQTRRPYMLRPDIIAHPLFQELVDRSSRSGEQDGEIVVACEVVLFEHLLWMLKTGQEGGSVEELAEFYTY